MTSSAGSTTQRPEVRRAAVVTHGRPEAIGGALEQLQRLAEERGVELLFPDEEREKHDLGADDGAVAEADLAVVLGGDGTMLRALRRFLGTGVPVIGANFGRVGFLAALEADQLEDGSEAGVRRGLPRCRAARPGGRSRRLALDCRERRRGHELGARADDRAGLGGRRRGPRVASVRRARLLDAVRIDGLQPLERGAGARLGARRDGGDVRRAAFAARAPAGRAARAGARRS